MKNIGVILAGGVGSRLGLELPKQFFKVAGKTVLEHTLSAFQKNTSIDEIAIISLPAYINQIEDSVNESGFSKVKKILAGGAERYLSSWTAIQAYEELGNCNLIFHDAVRPLVTDRIIDEVIACLNSGYRAVDVAVPATDTIISVDPERNEISSIPNREVLRRGQTPQGFQLKSIRSAYLLAFEDPHFKSTDDCGVVKKYLPDEPIFIVRGEESNMKLTYKEDLYLLDKLFQLRSLEMKTQLSGNKEQLKDKVLVVFGGSYGIGMGIIKLAQHHQMKTYSFSRGSNQVDICRRDNIAAALKTVYEAEGRIDYIINTAAVLKKEPLINMDPADITESIQTNYVGVINIAVESFLYLKESQGNLLFFTSSSYTRGRAFYSLYSSSKAAVVNFVQAIAQEWDKFGIKVNCINPERTSTPMRVKNFGNEDPLTLLRPQDVAEVALSTLQAKFSGQVIDVKLSDKHLANLLKAEL
jgi:2-C-methyl-D-erythritol 4-phosphate cytidylyltransferase